jgi:hypothetical protein
MMMICYCYPFSRKEESAISYQKLDIEKLTNDQCRTMFRFDRDDIKILCHALQICENRTTATNIEGLCIVLLRIAYPCRLDDLEPVWRTVPSINPQQLFRCALGAETELPNSSKCS